MQVGLCVGVQVGNGVRPTGSAVADIDGQFTGLGSKPAEQVTVPVAFAELCNVLALGNIPALAFGVNHQLSGVHLVASGVSNAQIIRNSFFGFIGQLECYRLTAHDRRQNHVEFFIDVQFHAADAVGLEVVGGICGDGNGCIALGVVIVHGELYHFGVLLGACGIVDVPLQVHCGIVPVCVGQSNDGDHQLVAGGNFDGSNTINSIPHNALLCVGVHVGHCDVGSAFSNVLSKAEFQNSIVFSGVGVEVALIVALCQRGVLAAQV